MDNQVKKISFWAGIGLAGITGAITVAGFAITQHRLREVAKVNRNGFTMDLQGLRHLIRQTAKGEWTSSDSKTLLAIRRSVFARVASLEVADPSMSSLWARLLNYMNLIMGYLGVDGAANAAILQQFEQALLRLENSLDAPRPNRKEITNILEELDGLI